MGLFAVKGWSFAANVFNKAPAPSSSSLNRPAPQWNEGGRSGRLAEQSLRSIPTRKKESYAARRFCEPVSLMPVRRLGKVYP